MLRDGAPITATEMETTDGEIYRLSSRKLDIVLIVYWHGGRPDASPVPRTYRLTGSNVALGLEGA